MAINTRDRRAAVLQFQQPGVWIAPDSDGLINSEADRGHLLKAYSGIVTADEAVTKRPFRQFVPASVRMPGNCSRLRRTHAAMALRQVDQIQYRVTTVDLQGDFTVDVQDQVVIVMPPSGNTSKVYLPDADDVPEGTFVWIKNSSSADTFDLDVVSSGTIDGTSGGTTIGVYANKAVIAATAVGASTREWFALT